MKPDNAESKCKEGDALLKAGNIDEAEVAFTAGLEAAKESYEKGPLLYNLALCYHKRNDTLRTINSLERAMQADAGVRGAICKGADFASIRDLPEYRDLVKRFPQGTKWLLLYTYGRVPFAILASLVSAFYLSQDAEWRLVGLTLLYTVFYSVLLFGLVTRRKWAWYLFCVSLLFDVIEVVRYLRILTVVIGPLWLWLNYMYIANRKHLFREDRKKDLLTRQKQLFR